MSDVIGPHADLLLEERVDDELVVYNRATDAYFTLNATATAVWDLATGDHTLDGMVDLLSAQFAVEPEAIKQDVAGIVGDFAAAGLLQSPSHQGE
jgi:hypothetical protein